MAAARDNRAFLGRAVRYLAGPAGIRQFFDIGRASPPRGTSTRSPRPPPRIRVAYVDNDPVVIVHARAILARAPRQ